jgi:hypothetical protein
MSENGSRSFKVDLPDIALADLPPGHPLASAWAKFARAVEHFAELRTAARAVLSATTAEGSLVTTRVGPGEWRVTVARLPDIPLRTACLVGDIAHGLRTALDHVAWACAKHHRFAGNPKLIQFPIWGDAAAFSRRKDA